jgi:hypothetical protein
VHHFPGPPIQTSKAMQQGPEGCNLFIFHIPNDLTNMDLYSLFVPFGTVRAPEFKHTNPFFLIKSPV